MIKSFETIVQGYQKFRKKYLAKETNLLATLAEHGQHPQVMIVACCDSRVDPAIVLQCDPGDLFVVRNVANVIPPYEKDSGHHGTSAALEFGICQLQVKHLIILAHSHCGGIQALLQKQDQPLASDFISQWLDTISVRSEDLHDVEQCAKSSLLSSYNNALQFPWIKSAVNAGKIQIHLWYFKIDSGELEVYDHTQKLFQPMNSQ